MPASEGSQSECCLGGGKLVEKLRLVEEYWKGYWGQTATQMSHRQTHWKQSYAKLKGFYVTITELCKMFLKEIGVTTITEIDFNDRVQLSHSGFQAPSWLTKHAVQCFKKLPWFSGAHSYVVVRPLLSWVPNLGEILASQERVESADGLWSHFEQHHTRLFLF